MNLLLIRPNTINFAVPMILNGLQGDRRIEKVYQFPGNVREFQTRPWNRYFKSSCYDNNVLQHEGDALNLIRSGRIHGVIGTTRYFNIRGKPDKPVSGYLQYLTKYAFPFSTHRSEISSTFILEWKDDLQKRNIPIIIFDCRDNFMIRDEDVELLRICTVFYKREIPFNRFNMFRSYSGSLPRQEMLRLIDKVQPMPIGIDDELFQDLKKIRSEKTTDLFWSGRVNCSQRLKIPEQLESISSKNGFKLDIADGHISSDDFYKRVAQSRICISIEGAGWDCYRHYEAIGLGSIPLMNEPTVEAPFWKAAPDEIFFKNDFSNLEQRICQVLDGNEKRSEMQQQLDSLVENHLLWSFHANRIVESVCQKNQVESLKQNHP